MEELPEIKINVPISANSAVTLLLVAVFGMVILTNFEVPVYITVIFVAICIYIGFSKRYVLLNAKGVYLKSSMGENTYIAWSEIKFVTCKGWEMQRTNQRETEGWGSSFDDDKVFYFDFSETMTSDEGRSKSLRKIYVSTDEEFETHHRRNQPRFDKKTIEIPYAPANYKKLLDYYNHYTGGMKLPEAGD